MCTKADVRRQLRIGGSCLKSPVTEGPPEIGFVAGMALMVAGVALVLIG
jgi:hypothetical protein